MPKAKWKNFTKEEIEQFVKESISFRELQQKIGYSANSGSAHKILEQVLNDYNIDYSHFKGHAWNKDLSKYEDALTDFGTHCWPTIKEKLFQERPYQCECCGLTKWNGKPIRLQVHHIDGNRQHNTRDNLQILCPNCHSQTDNWCSKNVSRSKQVSDEDFLSALEYYPNINSACVALGIPANQSNYTRARKLIENQ